MIRPAVVLPLLFVLTGCAVAPQDIGREPRMTPVGSGLQANVDPNGAYSFPAPLRASRSLCGTTTVPISSAIRAQCASVTC